MVFDVELTNSGIIFANNVIKFSPCVGLKETVFAFLADFIDNWLHNLMLRPVFDFKRLLSWFMHYADFELGLKIVPRSRRERVIFSKPLLVDAKRVFGVIILLLVYVVAQRVFCSVQILTGTRKIKSRFINPIRTSRSLERSLTSLRKGRVIFCTLLFFKPILARTQITTLRFFSEAINIWSEQLHADVSMLLLFEDWQFVAITARSRTYTVVIIIRILKVCLYRCRCVSRSLLLAGHSRLWEWHRGFLIICWESVVGTRPNEQRCWRRIGNTDPLCSAIAPMSGFWELIVDIRIGCKVASRANFARVVN